MKIVADNTAETFVSTGQQVETHLMEVDAENIAHVMATLSKQYSDGPLAVLREYVTNGIDSHVMAGQTAPVEVVLPSVYRPTLVVTDHGLGLSRDDIVAVYSKYGATTKADDDTQVGGFGIGAKAGFAVGSQFTVVGRKAGWRTTVLFSLDADNKPTYSVVAHEQVADLRDGVTIRVPVTDPDPYTDAARKLFAHFSPADVSCPGVRVGSHAIGSIDFGDGVHATRSYADRYSGPEVFVVMGGVAYPVSQLILEAAKPTVEFNLPKRASITVAIGSVDLTPSRESLRDSGRTVAGVRSALLRWHDAVVAGTDARIASASTFTEALFARLAGLDILRSDNNEITAEWNGQKLVGPKVVMPLVTYHGNRARIGSYLLVDDVVDPSRVRVLVGAKGLSAETVRRRAVAYVAAHPRVATLLIAGEREGANGLTWGEGTPLETVTFEQFKDETSVESAPGVPRGTFAYTVTDYAADGAKSKMTVADLRAEGDRVVVLPLDRYQDLRKFLLIGSGLLAVTLTGTQQASPAHTRLPQANRADVVNRYALEVIEQAAPEDWARVETSGCYNRSQYLTRNLYLLMQTAVGGRVGVDDPRFADLAPMMSKSGTEGSPSEETRHLMKLIDMTGHSYANRFLDLGADYPLLASVSGHGGNVALVAEYVNLVHAERERAADRSVQSAVA